MTHAAHPAALRPAPDCPGCGQTGLVLFDMTEQIPQRSDRAPLDYRTQPYPYARADGAAAAHPLNQEGEGGSTPTSALQLRFEPCDFTTAIQLNALWHSRLPNLYAGAAGSRYVVCYVAEHDRYWHAVAIWTSPIALNRMRVDDPEEVIELRRLAVGPTGPANTASRMLGFMARDLFSKYPRLHRLISYQDTDVHTGGIYRAAGWRQSVMQRSYTTWNTSRADRTNRAVVQAASPKIRWERHR